MDIGIGIGYGSDIQQAHDVIMGLIQADERTFSDPALQIMVSELANSSVNLTARFWLKSGDCWNVKFDLTRVIKEVLDANGIEIPFPQRVVHMVSEAGSA